MGPSLPGHSSLTSSIVLYLPASCALIALLAAGVPTSGEKAAPRPTLPPAEGGYDDGFFIRSRDGEAQFKVGGLVQFKVRGNDLRRSPQSEFDLERVRPEFTGRFNKRFRFAIETNFGAEEVELEEAWVGIEVNGGKDLGG
jgi:hypothetical protein